MIMKLEKSWQLQLQSEFSKPYFEKLMDFVSSEFSNGSSRVFPKENEIFRAFESCPFNDVKLVILGQDPYPTLGHAHGLCFSVESDVLPLPKSLKNIFKEIEADLEIAPHENGDLNRWTKQGVLLLNTVLTVREGQAESHKGVGWEIFTDAVIAKLNERKTGVVYLLWGSKAIKKAESVNRNDNLVLSSPHPSPLSAYRGFFGCRHFSKTNEYLTRRGIKGIEW